MRRRSGFTLIEILIAIALVVVLLSAMFGFLFDMLSSRAKALEHVRQHQAATAVINRLEEELLTCVAGGEGIGGGVRGTDSGIRVLFRGVAAGLASQGLDNANVLGDLHMAEYRFDSKAMHVEGRRGSVRDRVVDQAAFSPLEGVVHKLRFRFHDGDQWVESFDSVEVGHLPVAVEVALWLRPLPEQFAAIGSDAGTESLDANDAEFEGNFDDEAFARISDLDPDDLPTPDRLRVIVIPDASSDDEAKVPSEKAETESR